MSPKQCKLLGESEISSGFLDSFDYVLVDCDGVLWMGEEAIPGSPETIQTLVEKGKHIIYVTNNSTKDRSDYLEKCRRLGFPASVDNIFTTSYCAALYLKSLDFRKKVYVFGSSGIIKELDRVGIKSLPIGPDILPESWIQYVLELKLDPEVGAVIVGFDEHVSYPKLIKASSYLKNPECLFVATNKDEQFPTDNELIIPGAGTFVIAVEAVSGRSATVLGKPSKFMLDCIKQKYPDMKPERCLMIGDRLNTDILFGTSNGLCTLLVLTGINSIEEVRSYENSTSSDSQLLIPDFFLPCLGELKKLIRTRDFL